MQRRLAAGWVCAAATSLVAAWMAGVAAGAGAPGSPFEAPLARPPLNPPLVLNGGFGDYRSNHFHAGFDFSTGGRVGRPVYAPLPGWVERVRASGVGYGRSLYLHARDGRLLVFGHLDAFAGALASFVAAAQESSGQYEQDLWPEPGRFRVAVGQRIAWSGESGAGGPHLHFEIRRGDMAYHPLRAGLVMRDTLAPALVSLTLEPLDDASFVEGSAAPLTLALDRASRSAPESVTVLGRVRVAVGARRGVWRGVDRMIPWSVDMRFAGQAIECRFDSVSWATDMVENDLVYDAGRITGDREIVLWAPAGFRPRAIRSALPDSLEAGALRVKPGDPPQALRVVARDVNGRSSERTIVLRPPPRGRHWPDTTIAGGAAEPDSARWFEIASLPDGYLRVIFRGAPAGSHRVTIAGSAATMRDGKWSAVVGTSASEGAPARSSGLAVSGLDADGHSWTQTFPASIWNGPAATRAPTGPAPSIDWSLARESFFERGPVLVERAPRPEAGTGELVARSAVLELGPATHPLRRPLRLLCAIPGGAESSRVGLYGNDGTGWGWIRTASDSASGRFVGETRHLGRFALFADTLAPRISPLRPPRRVAAGPYSRWALEARLAETGSGVDAHASWFEVDGKRVPSEWDAEAAILRWRPLRPPAKGAHGFTVVASDHAGNLRRVPGRFVLD